MSQAHQGSGLPCRFSLIAACDYRRQYFFANPRPCEICSGGKGSDVADQYIVEQLQPRDMVITTDIPLAALAVEKGAVVLDHRGEIYTEENVRERLSMRDFMKEIRDSGVITGGPAPFGPKDVEHFANSLNAILTKLKL